MNEKLTLKERKRRDIVQAAIDLFVEQGYKHTSMDAVSGRAQVSKRTLYNHFDSKERLFQAVAKQMFEQSARQTEIEYSDALSLEEQLESFAGLELKMLSDPAFLRLAKVMLAECIQSPELSEKAMSEAGTQKKGLENWIEAAIGAGKVREVDPAYAAAMFIGMIKAHAFWPQVLMGQPVPDQDLAQKIIADTVAMFLSRYACPV